MEIDAWLREGGVVVASSDRAARALTSSFHRARRAEGRTAWPAPHILDWRSFVRDAWQQRTENYRLLLNTAQENSQWANIIRASKHTAGWLEGPRQRLADLAMEAHDLLCSYAPLYLQAGARRAWQQDAATLSQWIVNFDDLCETGAWVSASRLPLELLTLLEADRGRRSPLLLAGFDRLLPIQRRVFDAWGDWREMPPGAVAPLVNSFVAAEWREELSACARWAHQQITANPQARLLVITQDASRRRGEIERAFLNHAGLSQTPAFEFSLGIPLSQVRAARAYAMLLRWLDAPLDENEMDWLFSTGLAAPQPGESASLQACMRALRRKGLERTRWTLEAFVRQPLARGLLSSAWIERMTGAQQRLKTANRRPQSFLDWAGMVPQLLEEMGGGNPPQLSSAEYQALQRWQQAVDLCGSLGFDGKLSVWREFLQALSRIQDQTVFAVESEDAPILIAGPAESAGLTADAIWFLGTDEDTWPANGSAHPLLPIDVQRDANMPHATAQLDWVLAESITRRLVSSAQEINFSYARQAEGVEKRASRLATQIAGAPQALPVELVPFIAHEPLTTVFEDAARIAMTLSVPKVESKVQLSLFDSNSTQGEAAPVFEIRGGANVLTAQSQCAFKAFATARLDAAGWNAAEAGLTAAQRGQLLHAVLHSVWGAPPHGLRTLDELRNKTDLRSFVDDHVHRVLMEKMPACAREQMPQRYLELEEQRLTRVITEWLSYEQTRQPFTVNATEVDATTNIAGLTLKLRLDRVDRLNDGSLLIVDYKTGNVSPKSWELPRPNDVQLPLYAEFGVDSTKEVGGLVFAKIRPGDVCFTGKVRNATATLDNSLKGNAGLMKSPLTAQQLSEWREAIEQLARDFVAGRADVNPRDFPDTCEHCGLFSLCRVREREEELETEEETDGVEAGDE
jgi:probable DNA repair protein